MTTITQANGIEIKHLGVVGTSDVRNLAAALDRDHPAVRRIMPSVIGDADVWLDTEAGPEAFDPPAGWAIDRAFVGSGGGVALRLVRTEADDD